MKRKILLGLATVLAFGANAQVNPSIFNQNKLGDPVFDNAPKVYIPKEDLNHAEKTTASGTRILNYMDELRFSFPTVDSNVDILYPIFNDSTLIVRYANGLGSVEGYSVEEVFYPFGNFFNDQSFFPGELDLTTGSGNLTLDSVILFGYYHRPITTVTDELTVNVTSTAFGDIRPTGPYPVTGLQDSFVHWATPFDSVTNQAVTTSNYNTTISLTDADSQFHRYAIPVGMPLDTGQVLATAVSFKYTGAWNPNVDSILEINHFRPAMYFEASGALPSYTYGSPNQTNVTWQPNKYGSSDPILDSWRGSYWPCMFRGAASSVEHMWVSYVISCSDCDVLSIEDSKLITAGNAYPNPANGEINIPITLKEASNVSLTVSNVLGQEIKTIDLGQMTGSQVAKVDVSELAQGTYFATLNADHGKSTVTFTVK